MKTMEKELFEYQDNLCIDGRSDTWYIIGDKKFIEKYINHKEFDSLFGGYLTGETGKQEYLGVWGKRKVSKFKETLRLRGAQFQVSTECPKDFRYKIFSTV